MKFGDEGGTFKVGKTMLKSEVKKLQPGTWVTWWTGIDKNRADEICLGIVVNMDFEVNSCVVPPGARVLEFDTITKRFKDDTYQIDFDQFVTSHGLVQIPTTMLDLF